MGKKKRKIKKKRKDEEKMGTGRKRGRGKRKRNWKGAEASIVFVGVKEGLNEDGTFSNVNEEGVG